MKFLHPHPAIGPILLVLLGAPPVLFADELPADSYYQFDTTLETHHDETVAFSSLRGRPALISMFYGSCPHVCPMLISTIKQVERQLPEDRRARLQVAMISLDPERDTPSALHELAEERHVPMDRWRLARTADPADTRALAAVLGIKYKALPDGEFNHTSVIILVDEQGREIARSSQLGTPDESFVNTLSQALGAD